MIARFGSSCSRQRSAIRHPSTGLDSLTSVTSTSATRRLHWPAPLPGARVNYVIDCFAQRFDEFAEQRVVLDEKYAH